MSSHRSKRVLKSTVSDSSIFTSSDLAGQRYGVPQDLTDRLSTGVGSRVRKHVTEGYQRTPSLPSSSFSLSNSFPTSIPQTTFLSSSDALTLAHTTHDHQNEFDAVRYLKPENPLRPMWDLASENEERARRRNGGNEMEHWNNVTGDSTFEQVLPIRGTKRTTFNNDFDDEDAGDATDTDEPTRPPLHPTGLNSPQSSSSSLLHPLAASFSTSSTNPHLPIPMHANGSGYPSPSHLSTATHFGGQKRAPLRMTKSLPARTSGFGFSMGSATAMEGVEETLEDGFRVEDWVGKTDF